MDTTFDYSGELKPEGEGRRLWDWLHAECDGIEALRPLVLELCRTADRLQEVRVKIAAQGLSVSAGAAVLRIRYWT